jgi:hypothetical protein
VNLQIEVTLEVSHMSAPGVTLSGGHTKGLTLFNKPSAVSRAGAIMKHAILFLLPTARKPAISPGNKKRKQLAAVSVQRSSDAASGEILVVDYTFKAGLRR